MPIKYNYEVSVNDNKAKLNKDIFLFRGNRNIHYYFSIKGARFTFSKENEDLLESSNAIYAAVTVVKPNGVEVANAIAPVEDGLIHLKVTEDLIDEEVEVGDFDLVFDLFDDNEGAVTIPKIKGQFHVQERPCTTSIGTLSGNVNVVNQAVVDLAIATQENEQLIVVDDDGKYVKTTWVKGDKISIERLNKIEEGIEKNSTQYKDIANKVDNITVDNITLDNINGVQNHNQVNLFDATKCEDFFYDYKGNKTTALNGSVMSNWIPCKAGDKITRNGIATNVVCYFKEDKTFIKRVDSYGLSTITVPNNSEIAYVRLAVQVAKDRKIAYGEYIIPDNEIGDYYTIPKLKVKEDNLAFTIGVLTSPDGTTWRIKVDNAGVLSTENMGGIIPDSQLPSDFLKYTVTGQSTDNEDFLVAPHTDNNNMGYIFVMNYKGDVKWYKKLPAFAYNFRKYKNKAGQFRYTYMQVKNTDKMSTQGGYDNGYIVVMDEKFKVIIPSVKLLTHGSITETSYPNENHDYMYIDDNHYILSCYHPKIVTNIPGLEGTEIKVNNCILQEQKDGKVLWQWESANYPELYTSSHYNNEFSKYVTSQNVYTDYCHLNSVQFAPDGNILLSARSIGIMKVDKSTNKLMWVMGRGKVPDSVKLKGYTAAQAPYCQHDARYQDDGTITCFDNSGCSTNNVRIPVYTINDETKTLISMKEYKTNYPRSNFMGSVHKVSNGVYDIAYGGGWTDIAFEEYDFNTNTQKMKVVGDNYDLYRVFKGYEDNTALSEIVSNRIPCTKITLNKATLNFITSDSQTLVATLTPSTTTDKVVWSVKPTGLVTVENGVVTPATTTGGNCIITATCGSQSATCSVTLQAIDLSVKALSLDKDTIDLNISVQSSKNYLEGVNSSTSSDNKLNFDSILLNQGIYEVKNINGGTFTWLQYDLEGRFYEGANNTNNVKFVINENNTNVTIMANPNNNTGNTSNKLGLYKINDIKIGNSTPLTKTGDGCFVLNNTTPAKDSDAVSMNDYCIMPIDSTKTYIITMNPGVTSSRGCIPTIPITAMAGTFASVPIQNTSTLYISVTKTTGITNLNLVELTVSDISEMKVYGHDTITATLDPSNAINQNVTWESSDNTKATVKGNGLTATVTAVAKGNTIITCTSTDTTNGTIKDTCNVTVTGGKGTYTDVECITSNGTQYIDTEVIPTANTKVVMDANWTYRRQYDHLFGADNMIKLQSGADPKFFGGQLGKGFTGTVNSEDNFNMYGTRHKFTLDNKAPYKCKIDENTYSLSPGGSSPTNNVKLLLLSGYRDKSSVETSYCGIASIYACQIYENNTLIRDYIPVLDDHNIACLYDKINSKFYYSATTDFTYTK